MLDSREVTRGRAGCEMATAFPDERIRASLTYESSSPVSHTTYHDITWHNRGEQHCSSNGPQGYADTMALGLATKLFSSLSPYGSYMAVRRERGILAMTLPMGTQVRYLATNVMRSSCNVSYGMTLRCRTRKDQAHPFLLPFHEQESRARDPPSYSTKHPCCAT
jgi:hypothetical protein